LLLIEVNGDYWHGLPKIIKRDQSKATYISKYFPQYELKYLWEHEFNNKDRIINLIKYWLGLNNLIIKQYDVNQVQERLIDTKGAELLISKYHYAGRIGKSGINLGYYLDDQLIAVIIYSSLVRQEIAIKQGLDYRQMLELSRLVIHPEYQIKNLASHIIATSINHIKQNNKKIRRLISFADSTYNHLGTVYKASNWIFDGEVDPDYWYVDSKSYICHKKTLWNHAKKMNMTENEYCEKYGYSRIWGGKKYRYIYNLI